jgi:hypothetical protein
MNSNLATLRICEAPGEQDELSTHDTFAAALLDAADEYRPSSINEPRTLGRSVPLRKEAMSPAAQKKEQKLAEAKRKEEEKAAAELRRLEEKSAAEQRKLEEKTAAVQRKLDAQAEALQRKEDERAAAIQKKEDEKAAILQKKEDERAAAEQRKEEARVAAEQRRQDAIEGARQAEEQRLAARRRVREQHGAGVQRGAGLLVRAFSWLKSNRAFGAEKQMRVTETVALGEKRFVAVLQVEGRKFLIGGGATGVSLLTSLEQGQDAPSAMPSLSSISVAMERLQ